MYRTAFDIILESLAFETKIISPFLSTTTSPSLNIGSIFSSSKVLIFHLYPASAILLNNSFLASFEAGM